MSRRTFTSEQIKKLSKNKNVARCGSKSVRYSRGFKASAVKQYNEEGLTAVGIFEAAGFDLDVIGARKPNKLMHQWNKALRVKMGDESTRQDTERIEVTAKRIRSGRELRMLKAKVAYLEAENSFLAKLRAGKRK